MTILDRYVLRLFLKVLLVSFCSLTGLFIVIDTFSNIDEFIIYGEKQGGVLHVLVDYYGARVLMFFDRIVGLLALVAAMFAVTWLQRTNELTAIMAGGVRKIRVARPLILAAAVVSLLGIVNREMLIPSVRHKLTRNAQDWLGESARPVTPRYDRQSDILFAGRHSIAKEKKIDHPILRMPDELQQFGGQITAAAALYQQATAEHPAGYLLLEVDKPTDLPNIPSAQVDDRTVIFTPHDHAWLEEDQCFVASMLDFERLAANNQARQFSSSAELIAGLHNASLENGPDVKVLIHARMVQPLLDITLLFLGLPLVMRGDSRSLFAAAGRCLGTVACFFLVVLTCHALGSNYMLSPALAAWSPLMIFAPIATATSRPLFE